MFMISKHLNKAKLDFTDGLVSSFSATYNKQTNFFWHCVVIFSYNMSSVFTKSSDNSSNHPRPFSLIIIIITIILRALSKTIMRHSVDQKPNPRRNSTILSYSVSKPHRQNQANNPKPTEETLTNKNKTQKQKSPPPPPPKLSL